jgi:uncharacterized protein YjbI with pentapeptide repeats
MKRTISRLLLLAVVLLAGWFIGSLRLPQIKITSLFWFGFLTCLIALGVVAVLIKVWNKNAYLDAWIAIQGDKEHTNKAQKSYRFIWIAVSVFIVLGGLIAGYMIRKQNQLLQAQSHAQDQRISELAEMLESLRNGNQVPLMSNVLRMVEQEVQNNNGRLSEATISRVVELSKSFKPYRSYESDSLSALKLSPERGQLLISLALIPMDSASFAAIKSRANFSMANLENAKLPYIDFSGIDLSRANLKGADLTGSVFRGAKLSDAIFWGAKLDSSDFSSADMQRIVMSWAEVNHAKIIEANINGGVLENTKFRNSDLTRSTVRWAKMSHSILFDANLYYTDFIESDLYRANLSRANMTRALIKKARIDQCIMNQIIFDSTVVHNTWLEELTTSKVQGTDAILNTYTLAFDSTSAKPWLSDILIKK